MRLRYWFRPPRHVLTIFVAVAIVSAGALASLMWLLFEQDKSVELQRRQERLEQAADRAAASMQASLAELEQLRNLPAGVIAVQIDADGIHVRPEHSLLYYPDDANRPDTAAAWFADAEQVEFAHNDLRAAAGMYRQSAGDPDPLIRAAAFTRLGRVERKMRNVEAAIRAYNQLAEIAGAMVGGLPAELIAHQGLATVFEETHRTAELQKESEALARGLEAGRWRLTKSQYEFYSAEAQVWIGGARTAAPPDLRANAEAVLWLWDNRSSAASETRRLMDAGGAPVFVSMHAMGNGIVAVVGASTYLAWLCREAVPDPSFTCTLTDSEGHVAVGPPPPIRTAAIRTAAASKLPWTLHVSTAGMPAAGRTGRPLLLWVAVVLAAVWLTGALFIVRAINREARVAQLQSDFVSAVSHEFRSPLSSLCQISEMLASGRMESGDVRSRAYTVLTRESERLRRLVEGLLDFQRWEAGVSGYHFERIEIGEFIKSIIAEFQERIGAKYTIELGALEQATHVKADREALTRAIWNLLDNAIKYSPECRTVWVDVARTPVDISIAVRDRGLGIPLNEQRDIFEKFVRGADSKARRIKGTGIGLAMVQHIVKAHGAQILVSSRPGEGSRFTIVFPQEAIEA
jgi:signal transduction histidine kinase